MDRLKLVLPCQEYGVDALIYRDELLVEGEFTYGVGAIRRARSIGEWLEEVAKYMNPDTLPPGKVLSTQFLTVRESDNRVVGMIQVRHYLNEFCFKYAGHIGYSIRPSERRKGYGKEQLRLALDWCRENLDTNQVLIICNESNIGSRKVIKSVGGIYENSIFDPEDGEDVRRYWVPLFPEISAKEE